MQWFVNDLSINSQFQTVLEFKQSLEQVLCLRHQSQVFRNNLFCSRSLVSCLVTPDLTIDKAIYATNDRNFIRLAMEWMGRAGPFWNDNMQPNEDDYFEYSTIDATNTGLGEAARRILAELAAHVYSFPHSQFKISPLIVQHGLSEDVLGTISIENHWLIDQIRSCLGSVHNFGNWNEVNADIRTRFQGLRFSLTLMDSLFPQPFSSQIAHNIFKLLDILNKIALSRNPDGSMNPNGLELCKNHFGSNALFAPESTTNKTLFENDLTFIDPDNENNKLFCDWHGRINNTQPIRIHFEWPIPTNQQVIKVVYIGPKITKD